MEPARLTVGRLLNRSASRVNRHTQKKAVMVVYRRAGFGRAAVDKWATVAMHGDRYSRQRMTAKRLVSALFLFRCGSSDW